MKKVIVVHAHGKDCGYRTSNRIAERVQRLIEDGEWAKAYDLVRENDRTGRGYMRRKDRLDI